MKKYIYYSFFVIFLLNFNQVKSQNLNQFGLKAGANLMGIKDKLSDGNTTQVNKTGFYIGAFMEFRKSLNLSIQAEINYSSTDNKINDNIGLLHIPLLIKYKLGEKFEIYGGPESQFLLSVSQTDIKGDEYKKFILAADLGVGLIVSDALTLDARYNLAISNYRDLGYRQNIKLNFLQIGLAYKFDN
ncbi:outer membrane beta-barrel protein [Lutibacter flavus]|uniref:Outer membrane protein beta-barrel domain-containing protein n=1 Tax=Lutibacter flavus TaxID=691689 RepID=A0A238VHX5_9FLAO|nr:outer membrane beta-barrel protein [Lutibacter flavus]SNR33791.1 Outer membrane protein beta-barrel domain-containing protein [Lutibacter flavus]